MLEKSKMYLKAIKKYWIFIFAVIVIAIAFTNLSIAIWITLIAIIVYLASWIPSILCSRSFKKFMKDYKTFDDITIAKKIKKPLNKIQEHMFFLSQKQNNKEWVIIYINKHYYFYNESVVKKYKALYNNGLGEKEILEG